MRQGLSNWVRRWIENTPGTHNKWAAAHALKLLEEAVELCYAAGADESRVYSVIYAETEKALRKWEITGNLNYAALQEECADVAICLEVLVQHNAIDLEYAVEKKIEVLKTREWSADAHGVMRRLR